MGSVVQRISLMTQVNYYPGNLGRSSRCFSNISRAWIQRFHLNLLKEGAAVRGAVYPIRVAMVDLILHHCFFQAKFIGPYKTKGAHTPSIAISQTSYYSHSSQYICTLSWVSMLFLLGSCPTLTVPSGGGFSSGRAKESGTEIKHVRSFFRLMSSVGKTPYSWVNWSLWNWQFRSPFLHVQGTLRHHSYGSYERAVGQCE